MKLRRENRQLQERVAELEQRLSETDTACQARVEKRLWDLTQRLTYHMQHSPLAVVEWDPDFRISLWSEQAERLFGWKAEEVVGKRMLDFRWVHTEDIALVRETGSALQTGADPRRFCANRNYRKDGSVVWCEWYNSALLDESGKLRSILSLVLDVTARKRAEDALRENQALLRAVMDSSPDAIYVKDRESRLVLGNPALARNIGRPIEEIIGLNAFEYFGPEAGGAIREHDLRVMTSGQIVTLEEVIPAARGLRIFLSSKVPRRNAAGEIIGVLGISKDITELKRTQESLRQRNTVLDGINRILSQALSCQTDEELGRACLEVATEITQSRAGFIGDIDGSDRVENIAVLHHPAGTAAGGMPPGNFYVRGAVGEALAKGKGFFTNDFSAPAEAMSFPAEQQPLRSFLAVPLMCGGKAVGVVCLSSREGGYREQDLETVEALAAAIAQALTQLRAERSARVAEQRLWQAQKLESIGVLAGGVAHDFNNLLVSIIGNAGMVLESLPPGGPSAESLREVIAAGEQAASLTKQMLAYAGRGRFVVQRLCFSDLVREFAPLAQASVSSKIAVRFETAKDLPPVEVDRGQIEQVLLSLLLNAAEAIGGNSGAITVRTGLEIFEGGNTHCHPAFDELVPGEYVYLEVQDTGCGMNEEIKAKLFDPFFTTKFMGRGLGLAAVAGIVRYHKGAVAVSSAPGRGSCVTALFPAARSSETQGSQPAGAAEPGTVLVVEGEELVRGMAVAALEFHGYRILSAGDVRAAIEVLRNRPDDIAVIVLDLDASGTGEDESLVELRKMRPGARIILSSELSGAAEMDLVKARGIAGCVQKPYTATELVDAVKSARANPL